jgi:hypothetical protein
MKKKSILITSAVVVLFLFLGTILIRNQQDAWLCKEGTWVRKGSPRVSQPTTPCKGNRIEEEMPTIPPDSIVVSFYRLIQKDKSQFEKDGYKKNPYLADSFKMNIAKNPTLNPFLCSDKPLTNYALTKSSIIHRKAIVQTQQSFDIEKKIVPFELEAIGKEWKIINIKCP